MTELESLKRRLTGINSKAKRKGYSGCITPIEDLWCLFQAVSWCQSCSVKFESQSDAMLDHCHETGKFRGFLCRRCNLVLGLVKDDEGWLAMLGDYLSEQKA